MAYSRLWQKICHKVHGPRQGGSRIIVDAEDAETGVGKTSAAVALARQLSKGFGYELKKDDLTLSAAEYLQRYREHPGREQPSVLILDEAVGAGAGDARRAMSNSNLDLASAWQMMRVKRVVTISITAHWGDLDKRLKRLADFRIWTRKEPIGRYRPYEVKVGFDDGSVQTKKLDNAIHFPDMSGDPFYEALDDEKGELLAAQHWDADQLRDTDEEEAPEDTGPDLKEIAQTIREEGIDSVVSIHGGNKQPYIDTDLIEMDYGVSARNAGKVKKLLQRDGNVSLDVTA